MNINLAADPTRGEPLERSLAAAHRDMTHAARGFLGKAKPNHFVVREGGAIEKNKFRPRKPVYHALIDLGAARHVEKALGAIANLKPDRRLGFAADRDVPVFEIERNFTRNRERFHPDTEAGIDGRFEVNRVPLDEIAVQNPKNPNACLCQGCPASKKLEALLFTQGQKPGEMIDIGVGNKNRLDRRLPLRATRVQARRSDDLLAEIWRGIQKQPAGAVSTDGERGLAARLDAFIPAPGQLANRAEAIPLRKAAARRRTQDEN